MGLGEVAVSASREHNQRAIDLNDSSCYKFLAIHVIAVKRWVRDQRPERIQFKKEVPNGPGPNSTAIEMVESCCVELRLLRKAGKKRKRFEREPVRPRNAKDRILGLFRL